MVKKLEHAVKCALCHKEFNLSSNVLKEKQVTLHQEGLEPHEVQLTYLYCPMCGKRYPVIMDDETTLPLLEKLRNILTKQVKQYKNGFPQNSQLEKKRRELNNKLDFRRQKLAVKYNGSLYQLGNGLMEQLDYRYHARLAWM